MMAIALRCSLCGLNLPMREHFARCPFCEQKTQPIQVDSGSIVSEDQVRALVAEAEDTPDEPTFDSIHPKDVFEFRVGEFVRMGFGVGEAEQLAHTRTDVHWARKMLKQGCDLGTALEILL
jgi:endogenous inhibitor of DNA gyrase (YacG/DUF329 family)